MTSFFNALSALKVNRILAWLIFTGYVFPVLFLLGDFEFRIHDQLDSYNVFAVLADSGKVFSSGETVKIDNIMNGLPRSCFPSGYNIVIWLIMLFGHGFGFFVNYLLVHFIAFIGAYLFLKEYVCKNDVNGFNWLTASIFAILPVNVLAGISLAGIPLVLYAYLNLSQNKNAVSSYSILLLFALYSSMIHAGIFVLLAMGILFLVQLYRKKANVKAFAGIALLALAYCFIEFELIKAIVFSSDYVSHRRDFVPTVMLNIKGVIGVGILNALNGNYASANYPGLWIFLFAVFVLVYAKYKKAEAKTVYYVLGAIVFTGLFIAFWDWTGLEKLYYKTKIFLSFNPRRIHFLLPVGVIILFAVSARKMLELSNWFKYIMPVLVFGIAVNLYYLNEKYNHNEKGITFNEFFSEPLLKEIDTYINKPKGDYRIIHIGLEPTISQCYGFYTLDSYQNNYPMEYKVKFRKLIEKELNKDATARNYFDVWGNRCFLTAQYSVYNDAQKTIKQLDLNTEEFKNMGGEYVFSIATIENAESIGLQFMKTFTNVKSKYKIHLYKAV